MKSLVFAVALCVASTTLGAPLGSTSVPDWLVVNVTTPVTFAQSKEGRWTLTNGLISRVFAGGDKFGTIDFYSHARDESLLRAVYPEATVQLDNTTYSIGCLTPPTGTVYDFFNRSAPAPDCDPSAWSYLSHTTSAPTAPLPWTPGTRHSPKTTNWPPRGLHLAVRFAPPSKVMPDHKDLIVTVHYEMYEGAPVMAKWITIGLPSSATADPRVTLSTSEILAVNAPYQQLLLAQTDQAHSASCAFSTDSHAAAAPGASEPLLTCAYTLGPGVLLARDGFTSFRSMLTVTESLDAERQGLAKRRLYRLLAPWTMESPIFFHNTDAKGVPGVVDQMSNVGFEMMIYSFGSGFNLEDVSPSHLAKIKSDIEYASAKNIEVGGYDLICLDRGHGGYGGNVGDQWDTVTNATTGELGLDACFASGWVDKITGMFLEYVNISMMNFETDGPYGGGKCAATTHKYHHDLDDSVYRQTQQQNLFYQYLRKHNVYINQPDTYFFQGGNKAPMGYNENQYSLPRWEDLLVSRQGMYDDLYHYIPSMGWMFLPLIDYHGGGAAAAFEPMSKHLTAYDFALGQYFGFGVAACYRGPRLYDTPTVEAVVRKWVSWFKQYRDVLTSDIVHLRRADGQDIDGILHANSLIDHRGMAVFYNPTEFPKTRSFDVPLYFTGITTTASVAHETASPVIMSLSREQTITLHVDMPPQSVTWYVIQSSE